jgi:hypothetical protein
VARRHGGRHGARTTTRRGGRRAGGRGARVRALVMDLFAGLEALATREGAGAHG